MCDCCDSWYTLPYDQPVLVRRARVVMRFVITQLIFAIIGLICDLITITSTFPAIIGGVIFLLIIISGCYGVKKPNKGFAACYSWCNCVIGSFQIVFVIILTIGFGLVSMVRDYCYEHSDYSDCSRISISAYAIFYFIFNLFFIPIIIFYFFAFKKSQILINDVEFIHQCTISSNAVRLSPPTNAHLQAAQNVYYPPPPPPPPYQIRPAVIYDYQPYQPHQQGNPYLTPNMNFYPYHPYNQQAVVNTNDIPDYVQEEPQVIVKDINEPRDKI